VDWPTSKPKRRRIDSEQQANNVRGIFARSKSALLEPGKSKASKISLLVEKIQEALLKAPRDDVFGPSSSSPLPERCDDAEGLPASPAMATKINCAVETPSKSTTLVQPEIALSDGDLSQELDRQRSSSEFGDDDLDSDFLELARTTATKCGSAGHCLAGSNLCQTEEIREIRTTGNAAIGSPGYDVRNTVVEEACHDTCSHQHPLPQESDVHPNGNDEFSDDEDDFPDGVEEILAQYGQKDMSAKQVDLPAERWDGRDVQFCASTPFGNNDDSKNAHVDIADKAAKRLSIDEFDEDIDLAALEDTILQTAGGATSGQVGHSL
jgi:DNA replication ATP-dependent helicase Dna2